MSSIIQRFTNFVPVLADSGENDALAAHADALQVVEFPAGYDVKTAAPLGKMIQDGQISVGLYRKTQSVRQRAKPPVQFLVGVINRSAAVQIGRRTKLLRDRSQRHAFAHHFFAGPAPRPTLLPREMRRERSRI